MKCLLILSLAAVSLAMPQPEIFDSQFDGMWESFKQTHRKQYAIAGEENKRRMIWEDNVGYIQKHNLEADMGKHTHRLGINQYADMTTNEFVSLMNGFRMTNKTTGGTFLAPENLNVPDMWDWRDHGYVTPVKNQEQCGSCWAFSATGSLEGQHYKKTNTLVSLSEQNLVDCSMKYGNHGCMGGLMDSAFRYIADNDGIDTEDSYPYEAKNGECRFKKDNVGATDTSHMDIERFDEKALLEAVASVGPISVAIDASQKDFHLYKSGVFTSSMCSATKLDHGVLVVGFGEQDGDKYWLVKNSWGESWGSMGYIKMRRDHNNMCGIATQASYPIV